MDEFIRFDWKRASRSKIPEAVLCEGKSIEQICCIAHQARERQQSVFFSRLAEAGADNLSEIWDLDYDPISRTGILGSAAPRASTIGAVAIVSAGTSDLPIAKEAQRALAFWGAEAQLHVDVGVAGLWRLQDIADELRQNKVLIAVAGMEGALFSVLCGLVPGLVIAVPSPVGYGVSEGGKAALTSALATCTPGLVTVNIGNGFGAAAAAWKIIAPD